MFRRNLVLFIRRHKQKVIIMVQLALVILFISFIATIVFSVINKLGLNNSKQENSISFDDERETVVYGSDVKKEEYITDKDIIIKFIKYCNNDKVKEAYEMLSTDCKNAYYTSVKDFKNLYLRQLFDIDKTYEIQSWISSEETNTYKVKLITDMFDRGGYDDTDYIEEYYTIVNENNEKKLSINKYIKKVDINKSSQKNNIKINVISKNVYLDYEIYDIEFENKTKNTIMMDTKANTSSVFLSDSNNVNYSAYLHEIIDTDLKLNKNEKKTIKIKFNKMYNPNIKISSMNFRDIKYNYHKINEIDMFMIVNLE